MVDDIEKLARLLDINGLDDENKKLINDAIRKRINQDIDELNKTPPPEADISKVLSHPNILEEWLNGEGGGNGGNN